MKSKILFIIVLIFLIANANSLGITPGRTTLNYEKGLKKEITLSVINNKKQNMEVVLYTEGELSEYIKLSNNKLIFTPEEDSKSFTYKVNIPENKKEFTPGLHTADIIALQVPKEQKDGTYLGATVSVISELYVYVPYPGKYLDGNIEILNPEENSTTEFIVSVINRGKVGIGEARAIIDIYTSMNEKVASIETDYKPIKPGERAELIGRWMVNVNSGNYLAKVTLFYDGESRTMEKKFTIGYNALSIESILVNEFTLGEIAKLQILVENRWNQELKDVYANLIVYDRSNEIMADVKSASENIPPLSKKELIAYWDTVGVEEGEYNGQLFVKYNEKSTDKNLLLRITKNSLDISGVGYAIRGKRGSVINITTILLILVIIMLIINLAWFVFFKRILKKKK